MDLDFTWAWIALFLASFPATMAVANLLWWPLDDWTFAQDPVVRAAYATHRPWATGLPGLVRSCTTSTTGTSKGSSKPAASRPILAFRPRRIITAQPGDSSLISIRFSPIGWMTV